MEYRPFGATGLDVSALGFAADLAEIDAIFARHGVNTCLDGWIEAL